jgi:hypothetical protein
MVRRILAHHAEQTRRAAARSRPGPVGAEEISQRKTAWHRKARMDARTRGQLPVLPVLASAVDERRKAAAELLRSARLARLGETFTAVGESLARSVVTRPDTGKVWADDPRTGKRRDLPRKKTARSGPGPR